jgi:hypothetical protein
MVNYKKIRCQNSPPVFSHKGTQRDPKPQKKMEPQITQITQINYNKKFLRMFHGPGGGFYKKSPLAAGGKSAGGSLFLG